MSWLHDFDLLTLPVAMGKELTKNKEQKVGLFW